MEAIIFLLIGGFIAYFVMKEQNQQNENKTFEEATNPTSSFIHYKKRILTTSAYTQESTYALLYEKITSLVRESFERHFSVLLPTDVWLAIEETFDAHFELEKNSWRIRRALDIRKITDKTLLALAIVSSFGQRSHDGKPIDTNYFFANRAIEYLIEEKRYWPASLAKGLFLKFGFRPYLAPHTKQSRAVLEKVITNYPRAYDELSELGKFAELEVIKSVHIDTGNDWDSHEEIERKLKTYHPLYVNGI
jgi:hypothetical protein